MSGGGGDLTASDQLVVAVTVTGGLRGPGPAVLRSGARPGDVLVVTGPLGASAAGLRRLRSGRRPEDLAAAYSAARWPAWPRGAWPGLRGRLR